MLATALLKEGLRGADVTAWQQELNAAGYAVAVDGVYGAQTVAVTKQFQQNEGLSVDGEAGPKTQAQMDAILAALAPPPPPQDDAPPAPGPSPAPTSAPLATVPASSPTSSTLREFLMRTSTQVAGGLLVLLVGAVAAVALKKRKKNPARRRNPLQYSAGDWANAIAYEALRQRRAVKRR